MTGTGVMSDELERAAELGAEKALAKMMMILGVDIEDMADINALRADLINARKVRMAGERIGAAAVLIVIGAIITGAMSFLWDGLKSAIGGGH